MENGTIYTCVHCNCIRHHAVNSKCPALIEGYCTPRLVDVQKGGSLGAIINNPSPALPTDTPARKAIPLAAGLLDYFPAALAAVADLSRVGNDKHNPGEDLHWARGKSMDHADCIMRHLIERGAIDTDGLSHSVKVAWRALALLQEELEVRGAPMARGARKA